MTTFDKLEKKPFENIVGKEENAGNQHFLLFQHYFLLWEKKKMLVISIFFFSHIVFYPLKDNFNILSNIWRLQMLPIWAILKFCRLVKD